MLDGELVGFIGKEAGEGVACAFGILDRPLVPAGVGVHAAEDDEHGVVGKPGKVVGAELLELEALLVGCAVQEVSGGFFYQRKLFIGDALEVDWAFMAAEALDAIPLDPALLGEQFQADEGRVAGEGGERRVRRASVACRAEREDLP